MKMPEEKLNEKMFAPCGMNCTVCYKHCYHKKPCAGCLQSDDGKPEHCRKCKIKDCVKEKTLKYCYECSEYPCKRLKYLEKSYQIRYGASLNENSLFVKGNGLANLWNSKRKNTPVPNAAVLFPFMIENVVSVKKR